VSVCVCGHKATDHKSVEMSVPLEPRADGPIYKIGVGFVNDKYWMATATRFQESCHCGCTVYEEWQTE